MSRQWNGKYGPTMDAAKKQIELNIHSENYDNDIDEFVRGMGRKFAKARMEKGYSLRQVEAIAGKHIRSTLADLEVGVPVNAQVKNMLLLAKVLEIPYIELFYNGQCDVEKIVEMVQRLPTNDKKKIIRKLLMEIFDENE